MIPRRLRRGDTRPRYVLEVDPYIDLTPEVADGIRAEFVTALRSGRPLVTSGFKVRQLAPGMKLVRT